MNNQKCLILFLFLMGTMFLHGQSNRVASAFAQARSAGFSGVVFVAQSGKVIFKGVAGKRNYESGRRLRETDVFELASVSKQFTAMIIMMLKERGKLKYDDPINQYLKVPYPGVTIRHLLTHTSGLPDYQDLMDKYWDKSKAAGNNDVLEYLNKYAPVKEFEPGERYAYSNTGYLLLASIAEMASGLDFIELCRNWIFKPLGMRDTDIRSLEAKAQVTNFAVGHLKDSTGRYVNANRFRSSDYTTWLGNRKGPGRISSTARDLLKWDQALYTEKLVKKTTLEEAFTAATLNNGQKTGYGFGWEVLLNSSNQKYVQHTGDNPGYRTIIVRFIAEKRTIIILNNNAHPGMSELVTQLKG